MATDVNPIESILSAAVEINSEAERRAYVEQACGGDEELKQRALQMIDDHFRAGSFLESGAADLGRTTDQAVVERAGTVIGPYKLLQQIGEGGFGVVFMAEQTTPVRRRVALKILKPGMDTKHIVARFEAERQALAIMDHPNIARVFDGGATPSGRPFFVMELVKGVPITQFCDDEKLSPRQRLELFVSVCQAVQHAHHKGIIHRDLKPSNILVVMHDTTPVPKIIDFGIAKALGQELTDKTLFTGFAQMVGTPLYMSPEQAGQSGLDIDTRSDIYSLGVLLYELLTGTTPFDKERFKQAAYDEIRRIIREEDPPKPSTRLSDSTDSLPSISAQRQTEPTKLTKLVRGELDWIVMKSLEKDRNRRYETANGFATDVQRYLADEPVQACPPSAGYRFRKFARRNKRGLAAAAVVVLFIATIAGGIGWTARDRASRQIRLAGQVEMILDEAERLMREQKWPEALATAQRAESLIAGGEADEQPQRRVEQVLGDLTLVQQLDEARQLESERLERKSFNLVGAERAYVRAFLGAGLTIDGVAIEQAAGQCRSRPAILKELASALANWARLRQGLEEEFDAASWLHLLAVADAIDADPWSRHSRQVLRTSGKDVAMLRELADGADVRALPPASIQYLGQLLRDRVSSNEAATLFLRAQPHHPDDFWINLDLAVCLHHSKRLDEAITFYRVAGAIRPRNHVVHTNLGGILLRQNKLDEAIVCCRKAIEIDSKHVFAHVNLGRALAKQNKLDEAVVYFRKAIKFDPAYASGYFALGTALAEQNKLDEAIVWFRKAIKLDPESADAHWNLSVALLRQKKYDEAVACWRKVIELDPNHISARKNLALHLERNGDERGAIQARREVLKLAPNDASALNGLAWSLATVSDLKLRNPKEAMDLARKAVKLDPNPWAYWNTLMVAACRAGEWQEALQACEECIRRKDKGSAKCWNGLGMAMIRWQLGQKEEARAAYDRVAAEAKKHSFLQSFREEAENLLGIQLDSSRKN